MDQKSKNIYAIWILYEIQSPELEKKWKFINHIHL